jgi:TrmH family RNA methyltransferase
VLSQARLKVLRSLQLKKARAETSRFLVQGKKVVAELLQSTWKVDELVATEEAAAWVQAYAEKRRVPVHVLAQAELDRIGTFEKGNELIAIAVDPGEVPYRAPKSNELILALDGVRDPRNMGSLIRIADWFGLERIVCSADCMEVFNPKVVSSTMGSLFHLDVRQGVDLAAELTRLSEGGARVYIADMDGTPAYAANVSLPAVLVLGSESHGHSAAIAAMQAEVISIPRIGKAESLNVAMAAAALCMEITRQTLPAGPRR